MMSPCDLGPIATLVVAALLATSPASVAAAPAAGPAPLSHAMARLAAQCNSVALDDEIGVDEDSDPAFRKHISTYVAHVEPKEDPPYTRITFDPPLNKYDYEVSFSCLFSPYDPWPSLVVFEKTPKTRPPIGELSERCTARAARLWRDPGFPKRVAAYVEKDALSGDSGEVTIEFSPPSAGKAWPRLSCHLPPPLWTPEVSFFPTMPSRTAGSPAAVSPSR